MENFEIWLKNRLTEILYDLSLSDFTVEVYNERDFIKPNFEYGIISLVVKHLTAEKVYAATTTPLQIMVMSEGNGLEVAQVMMSKFFQEYNWFEYKAGTTTTKMQYSNAVVLNNFNVVGVGVRSVLYVSATLYDLENIVDLVEFTKTVGTETITGKLFIDDEKLNYTAFQLNYVMSGDCQPFPSAQFAKTVKTVQTLNVVVTIPCVSGTFVNNVFLLMGTDTTTSPIITGNRRFVISFKISGTTFNLSMIINAIAFVTAPDGAPNLQVGLAL